MTPLHRAVELLLAVEATLGVAHGIAGAVAGAVVLPALGLAPQSLPVSVIPA